MSADFIVQLIEYRYWILGIVIFISLIAMGLLGKFVKGAIKWILIGLIIFLVLASLGLLSSEEATYLFETFVTDVENFSIDEAILNSPT